MGRQRKLTNDQIAFVIRAYRAGDKAIGLASDLGVSVRTIQRIAQDSSSSRRRGRRPHEKYSKIASYARNNPNEVFPRSLRRIATMTESSISAVKAYLYRIRKDLRQQVNGVDFYHPPRKYTDTRGRTIPSRAIESYTVRIESWTNVVRLECVLKAGAGHATIRLPANLISRLSSKG